MQYFTNQFKKDLIYENQFMKLYDLKNYNYEIKEIYTNKFFNAQFTF